MVCADSVGEYYIRMKIGEQEVNLQLDTGSSTMAVPLKQCENCIKNGRKLDLVKVPSSKSIKCNSDQCQENSCHAFRACAVCSRRTRACCSINSPSECGFYLRYADGSSASGALVQSDVELGNLSANVKYGGILSATRGFETAEVDGIFGMAYKSLACNPTCVLPFFDVLLRDKHVDQNMFSICTGRGGGTLTLGGVNPALYTGKIQWAPMPPKRVRHFYDVTISNVHIGGKALDLPNFSNAIVDSGTTVLVIAPSAFLSLKHHFLTNYCDVPGLCGKDGVGGSTEKQVTWFAPGYCALLSTDHIKKLPRITIFLKGGVRLDLEPEVYMLKYRPSSKYSLGSNTYHCLGISYLDGLDRMDNNVILGNTVLQKYLTVYDRENDRIGFAESQNCLGDAKSMVGPLGTGINGAGSQKGIPSHLTWTVAILLALVIWVVVLSLCGKRREGYEPIAEGE